MSPEEAIALGSGLVALLASLFALRAASIAIRDNIDAMMSDIHKQGRWSGYAAIANALASAAIVVALGLGVYDSVRAPDPAARFPAQEQASPQARVAAICRDNWVSHSEHRRGTCAGHRGVRQWVNKPAD